MTAPRRPDLLTDLGAAALALVLVGIAGMLGVWQYHAWQAHRDAEARDLTGVAPVPLEQVMGNDDPFPAPDLGRPVEVSGEWLDGGFWVAGAGWARTFRRIVIPQQRSGLMAAWVMAFIFTFGELGATTLVTPPGESTLPVRIYTLIANTPSSEVAALALVQVCIVLLPLALVGYFVRGQSDGR